MELWVLLESPQRSQSSSLEGTCKWAFLRAGAEMSRFPLGRSWDLWLSLEAFPRVFPTRLSHRAVPHATVLGVHPRRESRGSGAKQVPLEWTETSAGLLECGHDPGVTLAFPVESASSSDAT